MITKFKIFENKEPDLRRLGKWFKCIKNYKEIFIKDNIYKVHKVYGDPQRAIEEFGKNNYIPLECISTIVLVGQNNRNYKFWNNESIYSKDRESIGNIWEYFELLSEEEEKQQEDIEKYNL